jgi:hypothetical protein
MLSSKRACLRVRTVGLVSSIVAVAAISLTLLADNGEPWVPLVIYAITTDSSIHGRRLIFIVHVPLQFAYRPRGAGW